MNNRAIQATVLALACGGLSYGQQPATRPVGFASATPRPPEYAATTRIPKRLLDDPASQVIVLPSEPGEYGEEPASLSGGALARLNPGIRPLPEGYIVARRPGRITQEAKGYLLELERVRGLPDTQPLRILPNTRLDLLETVVPDGLSGQRFAVTGRVTEFQGANYILLEDVVEFRGSPERTDQPETPANPASEGEVPPVPAETEKRPVPGREPTAEELIRELMQDRPIRPLIPPREEGPVPETGPADDRGAAPRPRAVQDNARWPEETLLADQLMRLVPAEDGWSMAFEDPGRNPRNKSLRVLPSRLLENAISLTAGGTRGVVLVVSGEVTAYKGSNFLLLRKVLIHRGNGNLR